MDVHDIDKMFYQKISHRIINKTMKATELAIYQKKKRSITLSFHNYLKFTVQTNVHVAIQNPKSTTRLKVF